ncbi:MAG: hypothetical protein Q8R20_00385 [Nanoarchaeota archaeon]|nr:hypothetical protein [Nanoarchaeota archaeon]
MPPRAGLFGSCSRIGRKGLILGSELSGLVFTKNIPEFPGIIWKESRVRWRFYTGSEEAWSFLVRNEISGATFLEEQNVPPLGVVIHLSCILNGNSVRLMPDVEDVPKWLKGHPLIISVNQHKMATREEEIRTKKALRRAVEQFNSWPENGRIAPWSKETSPKLEAWRSRVEEYLKRGIFSLPREEIREAHAGFNRLGFSLGNSLNSI